MKGEQTCLMGTAAMPNGTQNWEITRVFFQATGGHQTAQAHNPLTSVLSSGQHSPWSALWLHRQAASASKAPLCLCIPEAATMRGCRLVPHATAASHGIPPQHTTVHQALRGSEDPSAEQSSFNGDGSRKTSQAALWGASRQIAACQTVTPDNPLDGCKGHRCPLS